MQISVARIEEQTNYWFVRTQQGEYYQDFFLNGYIGINWDLVSPADVFTEEPDIVVQKIKDLYPDETHPGLVYTQLNRFVTEMKEGDIVLIPSKRSTHISFGIVQGNVYNEDVPEDVIAEGACPFKKRRRVAWFKTTPRQQLDPYLYMLFYSQHTITNANDYATFIDRALHSLYLKGSKAHLVLKVTTEDNVNARDFLKLLDNAFDLVDLFGNSEDERINSSEFEMKANVQSPGPIEIIGGVMVIGALALVLHYVIGGKFSGKFTWKEFSFDGETEGLLEKFLKFKDKANKDPEVTGKISGMQKSMERLGVELPEEIDNREESNVQSTGTLQTTSTNDVRALNAPENKKPTD